MLVSLIAMQFFDRKIKLSLTFHNVFRIYSTSLVNTGKKKLTMIHFIVLWHRHNHQRHFHVAQNSLVQPITLNLVCVMLSTVLFVFPFLLFLFNEFYSWSVAKINLNCMIEHPSVAIKKYSYWEDKSMANTILMWSGAKLWALNEAW